MAILKFSNIFPEGVFFFSKWKTIYLLPIHVMYNSNFVGSRSLCGQGVGRGEARTDVGVWLHARSWMLHQVPVKLAHFAIHPSLHSVACWRRILYFHLWFLIRKLLANNNAFYVPEVIKDLTTHHILTTELVNGVALDKIGHIDQELKNNVRQKNKNEINIASALEFSMNFLC